MEVYRFGVHAHCQEDEGSENRGVNQRRQRKGLALTVIINVGCDQLNDYKGRNPTKCNRNEEPAPNLRERFYRTSSDEMRDL